MPADDQAPRAASIPLLSSAALTVVGLVIIGLVRAGARIGANAIFGERGLAYVTAALAVASIVTIIGSAGLSAGTTKFIAELRATGGVGRADGFTSVASRAMVLLSIAGAVIAAAYASVDQVLSEGGAVLVTTTGVLALTFGLYLAGKAIAYGEGAIKGYVGREVIGAAGFAIAFVAMWRLADDPWVLVPLIVAYLAVGSIALARLGGPTAPGDDLPIRDFAGYGIVGAIGVAAGVGFTYSTALVASNTTGVMGAALIGAILTILEPLYLAPRAISLVLLPRISADTARGRTSQAARSLRLGTVAVTVLAAPVCAVLILERDRVLQLLFGQDIIGGASLGWFTAAVFVSVVGAPAVTALAATDLRRATIPMMSSLVGFGVAIVVWFLGIPAHGAAAIALGYLIGSVIQVTPPLWVTSHRFHPSWGSFWIRVAAAVLVVAAGTTLPVAITTDIVVVAAVVALFAPEIRELVSLIAARGGSAGSGEAGQSG
jgi:O-antigen/teichoic acid export membrane protein